MYSFCIESKQNEQQQQQIYENKEIFLLLVCAITAGSLLNVLLEAN